MKVIKMGNKNNETNYGFLKLHVLSFRRLQKRNIFLKLDYKK